MNKICTSIEQSKKLIELGLDVNMADMYYAITYTDAECNEHYNTPARIRQKYAAVYKTDIPAWSLTALLKLMPIGYALDCERENTYFITHKLGGTQERFDNPLDAAFEMICWLLENKKI